MIQDDEMRARLLFWRAQGVGPKLFFECLTAFGGIAALFKQPRLFNTLKRYKNKEKVVEYLHNPSFAGLHADLKWMESENHHVIFHDSPIYPTLLNQITDAPPVLFVKGNVDVLSLPQMAMVGARKSTPLGDEIATLFASFLAKNGLVITSGLALGIDAAAHRGALNHGKTIGVLAHGLDRIYPLQHAKLAQAMLDDGGAIVSEFPLGVSPLSKHFPRRNRIITGLALGVLVVEASLQSGSLVSARCALEQGREVFAIPGSIFNPMSLGCHHLIRQGATLVEKPQDILAELSGILGAFKTELNLLRDRCDMPDDERLHSVLKALGYETTSLDLVALRTGLTACEISSMLLHLELSGFVTSVPGGYIRLAKGGAA